jgi:hypothetical protein
MQKSWNIRDYDPQRNDIELEHEKWAVNYCPDNLVQCVE